MRAFFLISIYGASGVQRNCRLYAAVLARTAAVTVSNFSHGRSTSNPQAEEDAVSRTVPPLDGLDAIAAPHCCGVNVRIRRNECRRCRTSRNAKLCAVKCGEAVPANVIRLSCAFTAASYQTIVNSCVDINVCINCESVLSFFFFVLQL